MGAGGGGGGVGTLMVIVVVEEGKTYLGQVSLGTFAGGGWFFVTHHSVFFLLHIFIRASNAIVVCVLKCFQLGRRLGRLSMVIVLELLKGVGVICRVVAGSWGRRRG